MKHDLQFTIVSQKLSFLLKSVYIFWSKRIAEIQLAVLLAAYFILKGHENGAITGQKGHENGAKTGQKGHKSCKTTI